MRFLVKRGFCASFWSFWWVICCVFLTLSPTEAAEAQKREAAVLSVDFYPSGARFVFQASAVSGNNFEITLPGAFAADSVRFLTLGGVSSVRVESAPRDAWTPPALSPLKSQIDEKDRELKLLEARKAALEQTKAMLHSPLPQNFGDGDGKSLILYIEDAQAMRLRVENDLVDLDIEIAKTGNELAVLRAEYDRKTPHGSESAVRIQGTASKGEPLVFEAFTRSAGWAARYDMSLNSATGDIDAAMSARAWQSTGLDADGEFVFHTRQPSFAIAPPQVHPLVVDLQSTADALFESAAVLDQAMSQAPVRNRMEPQSLFPPPPQVSATLADVSVRGKGNLKGDGTPEDVALGKFALKSVPVLVSIPEQSREAWVVASMDSISEPLLPGHAELAVDGAATGQTIIPEYGMGQTYLPFGMASRLTAKKNRLVGKTGSSWLGKGILEDGYTLEITSGMEAEREVTVKDRLPLPANDKITLEVTKIDPAPIEQDSENRFTWKISVKPGETKKIVVEYTLRYPGEETLKYH